ncbi:glycosyltransferase family 4 protein [Methylobacterium sp. CM6247]
MPKLCLVSKVWRSGTGWYAQLLAAAIAEAGGQVTFISPAAEPTSREPVHPNLKRILVAREITGPASRWRRARASFRRSLTSILRTLAERRATRVFVFTIPEPFPFSLPLFFALRLSGARIVFIVHDPIPHAWNFPDRFRGTEQAIHSLSYRLAHHIVVLAPAGRDALARNFNIPASKVSVIPHGPLSVGVLPPIPWNGRLLAFGTIRSNKNVLETIRGVKLARTRGHNVQLLILGEPHPKETNYWMQCLSEIAEDPYGFEIEQRFVADEDLPGFFAEVDAFVLAYDRFDSQSGVAVVAALSCRPVIGTYAGGIADLFAEGMAGEMIVGEVTAESIAAAIASFRAVSVKTWQDRAEAGVVSVSDAIGWHRIGCLFVTLVSRLEIPNKR